MINPVSNIRFPEHVAAAGGKAQSSGEFQAVFSDSVRTVDRLAGESAASVTRFLNGENEDLHRVALDQQQAALAFDLFLQVRNKVVQTYQEVMRMQV